MTSDNRTNRNKLPTPLRRIPMSKEASTDRCEVTASTAEPGSGVVGFMLVVIGRRVTTPRRLRRSSASNESGGSSRAQKTYLSPHLWLARRAYAATRSRGPTRVADRDSDAPGPSQINRRSHIDAANEPRSRFQATELQFDPADRNGRDGLVVLEVLNRPFVPFSGSAGVECAEVSSLAGSRIGLPRVQPVPARGEFANHDCLPSRLAPALGRKVQPTPPNAVEMASAGRDPPIPEGCGLCRKGCLDHPFGDVNHGLR